VRLRLRNELTSARSYDLPPTSVAQSLPVKKPAPSTSTTTKPKRKPKNTTDDTPKAFARLMQYTQAGKRPQTLDNGEPRSKKRKLATEADAKTPTLKAPEPAKLAILKIMPGERMSDFSARVNQALPMTGLSRKGKKVDGVKERQTRIEKKIQRRIADWRKDEEKIKEKEEEERDLQDLEDAEHGTGADGAAAYDDDLGDDGKRKKKQKGKKGGGTKDDQDDADPWAKLKLLREKPKGLFDVAQAPPTFKTVPKETFKVKDGAYAETGNVPKAVGSLRRREELGSARKETIERYRRMMEEKRAAAAK